MTLGQAGYALVQSLTGNPVLDSLMVYAAEYLVLLIPLSLVYLWFQGREGRSDSIFAFSATVAGIAATYIVGIFYYHQPPQFQGFETILTKEMENAFPSQHTSAMFSLAWPLLYRERYRLGYLAAVLAVVTGFARVYTGLHFPVDIVGAVPASLLGFLLVYLVEDQVDEAAELADHYFRRVWHASGI